MIALLAIAVIGTYHAITADMNNHAPLYLDFPPFDSEAPTNPDITSIYDLTAVGESCYAAQSVARVARRRQIRGTRQEIAALREAHAAGWEVGPERDHMEKDLAFMERQLAALDAAKRSR